MLVESSRAAATTVEEDAMVVMFGSCLMFVRTFLMVGKEEEVPKGDPGT